MKKRGFTLIELLAVITILALILVISVPMIMNSRANAVRGLSNAEQKNLRFAGETVGIDLDDYMSDIYNCIGTWIESKCTMGSNGKWTEVTLTLEDLIQHEYFEDVNAHCSGSITIAKRDSGYKVTYNDLKCE